MQLAVNYSPQAATLLDSGDIDFDLYKCPDWPDVIEQARSQRPVYAHFPLHAGNGNFETVDWSRIERLLDETGTRYVNIHIAPHSRNFPGMPVDTCDPVWIDPVVERVVADVEQAKRHFDPGRIILENVPWDPDPRYSIPRPAIELETLNRVVEETGCGFLLDMAHAHIAALHLQTDPVAYLDALPVSRLREVHVTGTVFDAETGGWRDHFAMRPEDWMLAEHALACVKRADWPQPDIVTLEYGGIGSMFDWRSESQVLAREVPRLRTMIEAAQTHVTST